MSRIPVVLVGDHPEQPTGLARILGDLARRISRDYPQLDVRTVGYAEWAGLPRHGVARDSATDAAPFPHWVFNDIQRDWGAEALIAAWRSWFGDQSGILLTVWDPGRCLPYAQVPLPVSRWGYFAVDAENVNGGLSGPAAEAVRGYDRVLAYSAFGAKALETASPKSPGVPHLPHGLVLNTFKPNTSADDVARAAQILHVPDGRVVIGCVATNHARKDWGLVAQVIRALVDRGHDVHLWAHTNATVSEAWSLPQLFADCRITDRVTVTAPMDDTDLARCYAACVATIAPGRGEGFGYPIAESLACGAPCVHVDYAGGAEITPQQYRITPSLYHLVGPYALRRPILDPEEVTDTVEAILETSDGASRAACRQAALDLDWETALWPKWRGWIDRGLGMGV